MWTCARIWRAQCAFSWEWMDEQTFLIIWNHSSEYLLTLKLSDCLIDVKMNQAQKRRCWSKSAIMFNNIKLRALIDSIQMELNKIIGHKTKTYLIEITSLKFQRIGKNCGRFCTWAVDAFNRNDLKWKSPLVIFIRYPTNFDD